MKHLIGSILFLLLLVPYSCKTESADYQSILESLHAQGKFNGNAMVIQNGDVVFRGSLGNNGAEESKELNHNTVFRLASVGKQFTAMGIMILKERGELDYDQEIHDFIPELPYEGITIRHMLHHVSGLPDYVELLDKYWKPELRYDDPERLISGNNDIIKLFVDHKPKIHFKPGEKWEYSNTAYVFLASIIERVSGQSFADFMKENIFVSAGMNNTLVYYYNPFEAESVPNRAYGYRLSPSDDQKLPTDCHYLNRAAGDGGTFSTLDDLAAWDGILYTEKLVSKSTLEEAFTPAILNNGDTSTYGFGWGIKKSPAGGKVVEHSGGWAGFRTYIFRDLDKHNCIILLTNHSSNSLWDIQKEFIDILYAESPGTSSRDN